MQARIGRGRASPNTNTVCHTTIPLKCHDPTWTELDLRHQYIDDKALKRIIAAIRRHNCRTLSSLNLSFNKITDRGARQLISLVREFDCISEVYLHHQRPEICWQVPLQPGVRCEARYDGKHQYYPGVVLAGPFGPRAAPRYDVQYNDGDMNRDMPVELIRVPREVSRSLVRELDGFRIGHL